MLRYARAARLSGVPRDQLERFIQGAYVAQPHQLVWHAAARKADAPDGPAMIGIGGRRGPGKTHATFAQVALDDCQRVPELKFLFLRKVLKAARESFEDVRRKVLYATPHEYKIQSGVVVFPHNDSRIVLGHFAKESDIDNYLGIEYDGCAIEEFTQLSKAKVELLRGSIRTTKPDWRPRIYATTNPGGIGHQYFRSTFVLPWRNGTETDTLFLPASADQNRYLDAGYRRWLNSLSGTLGKMWRDGDWDVAGGAFFTNWNHDRVVCAPFTPPAHWRFWLAMDYGFQHWNVIYLLAEDGDGRITILDELATRRQLVSQVASALRDLLARNGIEKHQITIFVAGHDCFSKESSGRTIADSWQDEGWTLQPAIVDRKAGAAQWLKRLGNDEADIPATILITRRCARLIATMPMLLSNPNDPEDVLKVDCDEEGEGGDDPYDGGRYGIMVAPLAQFSVTPAAVVTTAQLFSGSQLFGVPQ